MRYAIYFTPGQNDPLTRIAASWLGRNPFNSAQPPAPMVTQLSPAEIAYHTASARRYGFHATLKAPFHLAEGQTEADLDSAIAGFAAAAEPILLSKLVSQKLGTFIASENAADLAALRDLIEAGKLAPVVDRTYPLVETAAAVRHVQDGHARGKVVIAVPTREK